MKSGRRFIPLAFALLCLAAFAAIVPSLYARPRPQGSAEMEVVLPRFVQVLMAGGDRYLAANLAGFRALVASTATMQAENYRILGRVQSDLAWLNPAHEDNYYIAAAILPWAGEAPAAQQVLRRASAARPFDWQPAFYYAFNVWHFENNPQEGARWLRRASLQTRDEMEQIQLQQLAAQWATKGGDRELAIRLVRAMAKETRYGAFARFLEKRAQRLENLRTIEMACMNFKQRLGYAPESPTLLVSNDFLSAIPIDPFATPYSLDANCNAAAVVQTANAARKTP